MSVSIDDIHGEWIALDGRYNLNIELVPATLVETWTIPIGEEG
jgi:hypothetical protein